MFDSVRQIVETRLFASKILTITLQLIIDDQQRRIDAFKNFVDGGGTLSSGQQGLLDLISDDTTVNGSPVGTTDYLFDGVITNLINQVFPGLNLTVPQFQALNPNRPVVSGRAIGSNFLAEVSTEKTSFPIFLEGRQFVQPLNSKFAILTIDDSVSVGREFGNAKGGRRRSGSVRIKLYAPHGTGTKIIRDMADELDEFLAYTAGDSNTGNGGTFFMKSGSLRQVSENTDGFLEYNLDYIYDYYTS